MSEGPDNPFRSPDVPSASATPSDTGRSKGFIYRIARNLVLMFACVGVLFLILHASRPVPSGPVMIVILAFMLGAVAGFRFALREVVRFSAYLDEPRQRKRQG
jgi:hypothetical protein